MPLDKINVGEKANDGTGDSLRGALEKVNDNFDALTSAVLARLLEHPGFAPLRHEHENAVSRFVADAPPDSSPPMYGAMWIDAAANKIYLATGTASSSDWREVAFVS